MKRGPIQRNKQINGQVGEVESPKKMQGEYLLLKFISYLQSDTITVFEASLCRSNAVVQISQNLTHMNFTIGERPKPSYMSGLANIGAGLNFVNLEYHQSVAE